MGDGPLRCAHRSAELDVNHGDGHPAVRVVRREPFRCPQQPPSPHQPAHQQAGADEHQREDDPPGNGRGRGARRGRERRAHGGDIGTLQVALAPAHVRVAHATREGAAADHRAAALVVALARARLDTRRAAKLAAVLRTAAGGDPAAAREPVARLLVRRVKARVVEAHAEVGDAARVEVKAALVINATECRALRRRVVALADLQRGRGGGGEQRRDHERPSASP
mmetsp:Transcript_26707/g.67674  ORF Transcript_26707/g.67674 Transcript_26707/m.67674 type:complete len:224 (-) Transcript_26707:69-740(-)